MYHENSKPQRIGLAILVPDKNKLLRQEFTKKKDGYPIIVKGHACLKTEP